MAPAIQNVDLMVEMLWKLAQRRPGLMAPAIGGGVGELVVGADARSTKAGAHGPGDLHGLVANGVQVVHAQRRPGLMAPAIVGPPGGEGAVSRRTLNEGRGSWPRRSRRRRWRATP